ncbi:hypothetical protein Tco_0196286 [Tanacetum coccineum]
MNTPITYPSVLADDVFDDPLIIEAEVEGYLVRRVFVDQGFSREQLIPIGKVELEVTFGSDGPCRKTVMKFIVLRVSSLYNIILGRTEMREVEASQKKKIEQEEKREEAEPEEQSQRSRRIRGREGARPSCFPRAEDHNRHTILQRMLLAADRSTEKQYGCICMATFERDRGIEKRQAVMKEVEE